MIMAIAFLLLLKSRGQHLLGAAGAVAHRKDDAKFVASERFQSCDLSCRSGIRSPKDADQSHKEAGTCHLSLDHSNREPQGSWKQIRSQVESEAHEVIKGHPSHGTSV